MGPRLEWIDLCLLMISYGLFSILIGRPVWATYRQHGMRAGLARLKWSLIALFL